MADYKQHMDNMRQIASNYQRVPDDYNMFYPQQHNIHPQGNPAVFTAPKLTAEEHRDQLNPAASLYQSTSAPVTLFSASSRQCGAGCCGGKPDPRNPVVKPLYAQWAYKGPIFGFSNNLGMYS